MTQPTQTPRTILALDLGTTTGWALRAHDGLITSGTANPALRHQRCAGLTTT